MPVLKRPATRWHSRETGSGPPLVLLHGIGMSHSVWDPVMPYLQSTRRAIAFDIAGFGQTPALSARTPPTIQSLVEALGHALRATGIDEPVDIAGNSLGGCMALEAARCGLARSAIAISPIGLWCNGPPFHVKYVFGMLRWLAVHCPALLEATMRPAWLRELALAVPMSVGSRRMPTDDAVRSVRDLRSASAFAETFAHTRAPFFGRDISVPITVVFGDRDWILTTRARKRHALPAHTRWLTMSAWGHVPMWVHPDSVARVILDSTVCGPSPQRRGLRIGD